MPGENQDVGGIKAMDLHLLTLYQCPTGSASEDLANHGLKIFIEEKKIT